MNQTRRTFLERSLLTGTAISLHSILQASMPVSAIPSVGPEAGATILFQGDSITDGGREKTHELPNSGSSFGGGYAFLAASALLAKFPSSGLSVYNRGISGNKVHQLAERWEKDCIGLSPNVLSILIGVNDYWHMRSGNYDGNVERYTTDFRALLSQTKQALPGVKLVICQPFVLPGTTAVDESWLEPFAPYQTSAAMLAKEFQTTWVPFQETFNEAMKHAPAPYWAHDGVHPSMAGSWLMAAAWLKAVYGIEID